MVGRCESILHGTCIQGFLWHLYLALHYFSGLALRAAMVKANCCLRLRALRDAVTITHSIGKSIRQWHTERTERRV